MRRSNWGRRGLSVIALAMLQACGGGSETVSTASAASDDSARQAAAVLRPLNITESTIKPTVSADQLLNWAEYAYPALFAQGVRSERLVFEQRMFTVRVYPGATSGSSNYLGVTQGGTIYALGEFTQGRLERLGSVESYACRVAGGCGPALKSIRRVYAQAGSLQCQPDSGTSLLEMRRRLTDAGVRVGAASCSYMPVLVPAVCGATDARIWVFEVEAADMPLVSANDFQPVEKLNEGTGQSSEFPLSIERACDY